MASVIVGPILLSDAAARSEPPQAAIVEFELVLRQGPQATLLRGASRPTRCPRPYNCPVQTHTRVRLEQKRYARTLLPPHLATGVGAPRAPEHCRQTTHKELSPRRPMATRPDTPPPSSHAGGLAECPAGDRGHCRRALLAGPIGARRAETQEQYRHTMRDAHGRDRLCGQKGTETADSAQRMQLSWRRGCNGGGAEDAPGPRGLALTHGAMLLAAYYSPRMTSRLLLTPYCCCCRCCRCYCCYCCYFSYF